MSKKIDLTEARAIINWMNLNEDIRELSLKSGDLELHISRNEQARFGAALAAPAISVQSAGSAAQAPVVKAEQAPAAESSVKQATPEQGASYTLAADEIVIKSPMVGTFYASPKPGAPTFVKEGDVVTSETVLCIVEVMKLMNNLEAGVDGVVHKILVKNEAPVAYNEPLIVIKLKS